MCGITGIFNFGRPISQAELLRFTLALGHRGPDAYGIFIDGDAGLGHTRLSILDLSEAGKCPMPCGGANGERYRITFNGEIYNFLELRAELKKKGHVFKSDTDTEVIVAAYIEWGEDCLLRFNGMWAFGIWDTLEKKLFLARDRFGIKPLYFLVSNRFAFASELKAFPVLDGFQTALNEAVVPQLISSSYAYEGLLDDTIMRGIRRLPGGCSLTLDAQGQIQMRRWWRTIDHIPQVPVKYEEQVERFRELFFDAVRIRMRSDVPVGTCLSGGIDSSAVASTMAQLAREGRDLERCAADWQRTFVATFPGTMLDEREYADEVVRHVGASPHYYVFKQEEAVKYVLDSVWAMEDVYGGLAVPTWCLYRELRRKRVVVSLDGHGADELLCGYSWYLDCLMQDVNRALYDNFHATLLPAILRNFDRCSSAHGIEVRMPFMDWRLVTFCFGLPADSKIGGGFTKRILRDAMKGIMPERVRARRTKLGFNSPMIEWYNCGLRPFIEKVVNDPLWIGSPLFDGRKEREQILAKTRAQAWKQEDWNESLRVWTLMNLVIWQILFVERREAELRGVCA